ncbi:hypothetical protein [Ostreiculturibacter nitratireducens]|uniref:hypothetical protein n=1 Tax=Ostreiculturibacter nitratireducens TaxID=3075226 RepID=UPI0031B584FD
MNDMAAYRAYRPNPLAASDRKNVTFLFGGLTWRAEKAIEAAFESAGLRARRLPAPTREDLIRGRELADIGQCCPTAFVTGNLANHLLREREAKGDGSFARDQVYVTAGSCGSCRFGQYHQSYELALRNLGMEDFRIFLFDQSGKNKKEEDLDFGPQLLLGIAFAIMMADAVQDLEYQLRPYEVEPGATDRASEAAVKEICEALRTRRRFDRWGSALAWHLTTGHFVRAMRRAARYFDRVEVDRLKVKPKVKITGEFYLQTVEGAPNYNIHSWLESEGAEVYPAAVTIWLDYLMRYAMQEQADREGLVPKSGMKRRGYALAARVLRRQYDSMRRALGSTPHELPQQSELRDLASPYFDARLSGGEGDMLVGKAIWSHLHRKAHMICELSPYSCMPNTMSVGAMAGVLGRYPEILYAPLEIKGDSEIHALSRCQMVLTEAKSRARAEYEAALAATGLTEERARELMAARPEIRRGLWKVPHHGAAGTAANVILELGGARL